MQLEIYSQFPPKITSVSRRLPYLSNSKPRACWASGRARTRSASLLFPRSLHSHFVSRRCRPEVPRRSKKITACYWHETSFPLSHKMSTEQKGEGFFFAQPQAKPWFNFNVYQNSGGEERQGVPGQAAPHRRGAEKKQGPRHGYPRVWMTLLARFLECRCSDEGHVNSFLKTYNYLSSVGGISTKIRPIKRKSFGFSITAMKGPDAKYSAALHRAPAQLRSSLFQKG